MKKREKKWGPSYFPQSPVLTWIWDPSLAQVRWAKITTVDMRWAQKYLCILCSEHPGEVRTPGIQVRLMHSVSVNQK